VHSQGVCSEVENGKRIIGRNFALCIKFMDKSWELRNRRLNAPSTSYDCFHWGWGKAKDPRI